MTLLIDNYDSFSYNLYQAIGMMDNTIRVVRNDELSVEEISSMGFSRIIISPGPGRCEDAGISIDLIRSLGNRIPILVVCLGHQAICTAFGAVVTHAKHLVHGKSSLVEVDTTSPLFTGLSAIQKVARYHSLAALESTMPSSLKVTSRTSDGEIMAVQHNTYPIFGVQFHPESIMTQNGPAMLRNFMHITKQGESS